MSDQGVHDGTRNINQLIRFPCGSTGRRIEFQFNDLLFGRAFSWSSFGHFGLISLLLMSTFCSHFSPNHSETMKCVLFWWRSLFDWIIMAVGSRYRLPVNQHSRKGAFKCVRPYEKRNKTKRIWRVFQRFIYFKSTNETFIQLLHLHWCEL